MNRLLIAFGVVATLVSIITSIAVIIIIWSCAFGSLCGI